MPRPVEEVIGSLQRFRRPTEVAVAIARLVGAPPPQHAQDYPPGMGHFGAPRGLQRRYWVNLPDGRRFKGTKPELLAWADENLTPPGAR